ncbi:hypothetical protein AALO_G00049470 [Alosa alosa]|uniref:Uncharacterized protein n=1 Tax=Alosa alosa TaxID=278164 RepID=A0AAV6H489_9TELE|nr:hypothetical protein AALO_G00049470 [Alosa alosa]
MTSVNSPACLLARNQFYRNVESSAKMTPDYGLSECLTQPKQRVPGGHERLDDQRGAAGTVTAQLPLLWAEQSSRPAGEVKPEEQTSAEREHSSAWLYSTLYVLCTAVWT